MSAATALQSAVLDDRGVVSVAGADAEKMLGGLITNDISILERAPALYAALLTPQGKILFDFIVTKTADGLLLDTARNRAGDLAKRLSMYKLRAAVEIRDVSNDFRVAAVWGEADAPGTVPSGSVLVADPRLDALGWRVLMPSAAGSDIAAQTVTADAYHAHRVALGVPEGGRDFPFGDAYPHEALLDQLHGVSFTKGCFVGQEVVSRMQHRTTVRKRVVVVRADEDLPDGSPPVLMGEVEIGRLGSVVGARGLALMRIDRVAEAGSRGLPLTSGGIPVEVSVPPFATFVIGGGDERA